MTASHDTVKSIYDILYRHLTSRQITQIILELEQVPGNQSFRETVSRLIELHTRKRSKAIEE